MRGKGVDGDGEVRRGEGEAIDAIRGPRVYRPSSGVVVVYLLSMLSLLFHKRRRKAPFKDRREG